MSARGKLIDRNWRRNTGAGGGDGSATGPATIDDISVLVVPVLAYKREWARWKADREEKERRRRNHEGSGEVFGDCVEAVANGDEAKEEVKEGGSAEEEEEKPEK